MYMISQDLRVKIDIVIIHTVYCPLSIYYITHIYQNYNSRTNEISRLHKLIIITF